MFSFAGVLSHPFVLTTAICLKGERLLYESAVLPYKLQFRAKFWEE